MYLNLHHTLRECSNIPIKTNLIIIQVSRRYISQLDTACIFKKSHEQLMSRDILNFAIEH